MLSRFGDGGRAGYRRCCSRPPLVMLCAVWDNIPLPRG